MEQARKEIPCPFYSKGNCRYGDFCQLRHDAADLKTRAMMDRNNINQEEEHFICGICLEDVVQMKRKFGLLSCCNHMFCLDCLMEWRSQKHSAFEKDDTNHHRSCPTCRKHSDYVVPSLVFANDRMEKDGIFAQYKEKVSKIPCKRYVMGQINSCSFGKDCFYAHLLEPEGQDIKHFDDSMKDLREERQRRRQRHRGRHFLGDNTFEEDLEMINSFLMLLDMYSNGMARGFLWEGDLSSSSEDEYHDVD